MSQFRPYNPQVHRRHSIRLKGYDYSQAGAYFITLCTHNRDNLFGQIVNGEMQLNTFGQIAGHQWRELAERFADIELDQLVIMPNHIHGIIIIHAPNESQSGPQIGQPQSGQPQGLPQPPQSGQPQPPQLGPPVRAGLAPAQILPAPNESQSGQPQSGQPQGLPQPPQSGQPQPPQLGQPQPPQGLPVRAGLAPAQILPAPNESQSGQPQIGQPQSGQPQGLPLRRTTIGDIVGAYKSFTTNQILQIFKSKNEHMGKIWQRNYWEHIIRSETAYQRIAAYILNNPAQWELDQLYTGGKV